MVALAVAGLFVLKPLSARADVIIDTWSCSDAAGTFTAPTTLVIACYFEDAAGNQFPAATINNDSGEWNATDFPEKPSDLYYLFAVGDDGSTNSVGPLSCP
jgi:hypothetical protein